MSNSDVFAQVDGLSIFGNIDNSVCTCKDDASIILVSKTLYIQFRQHVYNIDTAQRCVPIPHMVVSTSPCLQKSCVQALSPTVTSDASNVDWGADCKN